MEEANLELNASIEGKKVFEYLLLPKAAGEYEFNPSFTYFSPDSAKYITLAPGPYTLRIRQGTGQPKTAQAGLLGAQEEVGPLMLNPRLSKIRSPFLGSPIFWVLVALPLLLFGGLLGWRYRQSRQSAVDPAERRAQEARRIAQSRLSQAESHLQAQDNRAFYDEISKAILGYVSDKLSIPRSALSKATLRERLEELSLQPALIDIVLSIIQDCEMALFAGRAEASKMKAIYERAEQAIAGMEKAVES